jgi:hypothetical protein
MFKPYKLKVSTADLKYCGAEPEWANTVITPDNRQLETIKSLNWYSYVCTSDDRRRFLQDWIKIHQLNPRLITAVDRAAEREIKTTACHLARMSIMGYPLSSCQQSMIDHTLCAIEGVKNPAEVSAAPAHNKNPADRRTRMIDTALETLEDSISDLLNSGRSSIKPESVIKACGNSRAAVQAVSNMVELNRSQFVLLASERSSRSRSPSQLSEAFQHITDANVKATVKWLEQLQTLATQQITRPQRVRQIKPRDPNKLVSKLVYLKSHAELKLTSCDPKQCIDADEIWTYCVSTRKITVYRATPNRKLSVKGTGLINVDLNSSSQKTLRKPQQQLEQFSQSTTKKLAGWFDAIGTTPHRPRPRLNSQTIILKAIKKN